MPLLCAQCSTVTASAWVNVSSGPKSSMPGISVTPTMCQSRAGLAPG